MDILGFKNLVQDRKRGPEIGDILKLPYLLRDSGLWDMLKMKGMMITSISDTLVFSVRTSESGAMNKMIRAVSVWSLMLLRDHGILVRGGMAVGPLYHDQQVVYGPALVDAYLLESREAKTPRILIREEDLEPALKSCGKSSRELNRVRFLRGEDGKLFLHTFEDFDLPSLEKCLERVKKMDRTDPGAEEKLQWMEHYLEQTIAAKRAGRDLLDRAQEYYFS